ncbi:hypothetical protein CH263_25055 [Rhodococcus sp. 06-1059B-a]|nr:hypothetical protein [Rhodococcus sp. 06-1059B-a]OZD58524.1 hypothetical protein CH263_25055 [Rhodococcus sp. 06-1059B-a]
MITPVGVPTLRDYGRMLVRGWALILAATVLSVAAAWIADSVVAEKYTATSRVFLTAPGPSSPRAAMEGNRSSLVRVESYVGLATSEQVLRRTIVDVGLPVSPDDLKADLLVVSTPGSALIDISATQDDPTRARDVANSVALNLIQLAEEIDLGANGPVSEVTLIDAAGVPSPPSTLMSALVLGGAMGATVAAVLVVGAGVRRDSIDSRRQVTDLLAGEGVTDKVHYTGGAVR